MRGVPEQPPVEVPGLARAPQVYEQIAELLVGDIRAGVLRPGERLPSERDLAGRLRVGRSSVREALAELQVEGILEIRPGSGSYVSERAPALVRSRAAAGVTADADASPSALLDARLLLEPAIAATAAERGQPDLHAEELLALMEEARDPESAEARARWNDADRLFHRQIAVMSGNPVLVAIADLVATMMDQPLWQRLRDDSVAVPGRMQIHMAEHRMIYEAVAEGDPTAARFYAEQHLGRVRRYMSLDPDDPAR
jgi:DNA-binding FadR family transcriptional regulator